LNDYNQIERGPMMNILYFVERIRNFIADHIEELEKPLFGLGSNLKAVIFTNRTISSRAIHGGNGDRDVDRFIVVTSDGWYKYEIETETNIFEPRFKITRRSSTPMSDMM
jgi:hypothetical protein